LTIILLVACQIDLHGLYVNEAVFRAESELGKARVRGDTQVVFIVGRGLHSAGGVVKIRPAVEQLIEKHSLRCLPDQPHAGCLTVQFVERKDRGWLSQLGRCAIM
jgi:DNA-nicking Smr family endonuclease